MTKSPNMSAAVPAGVLFNGANSALRSARYMARAECYAQADNEVAVAGKIVQLLQTANPPVQIDVPSGTLTMPKSTYSGVAQMFDFQMLRWGVTAADLDDGLYTED